MPRARHESNADGAIEVSNYRRIVRGRISKAGITGCHHMEDGKVIRSKKMQSTWNRFWSGANGLRFGKEAGGKESSCGSCRKSCTNLRRENDRRTGAKPWKSKAETRDLTAGLKAALETNLPRDESGLGFIRLN